MHVQDYEFTSLAPNFSTLQACHASVKQGGKSVKLRCFTIGVAVECTGISIQIGSKLRDWAVRQAGAGCYSRAALSSNDSKTRYTKL